jgi:peptidoglycan/xylan/chitin deacetylase (PgdA/CDA1 family)
MRSVQQEERLADMNRPCLEVARFLENTRCAVTTNWDDNHRSNTETLKILDSMNMRGTFYVDLGNPKWTGDGLTDSQLIELAARHEVGSHTWSNLDLNALRREDPTRRADEIKGVHRRCDRTTGTWPRISLWTIHDNIGENGKGMWVSLRKNNG